jgi:hypothetical protein
MSTKLLLFVLVWWNWSIFPEIATAGPVRGVGGHSHFESENCHVFSGRVAQSDLTDLFDGELCLVVSLTSRVALSHDGVLLVVPGRPLEQVVRPTTGRVVAGVPNEFTGSTRAEGENEGNSVGSQCPGATFAVCAGVRIFSTEDTVAGGKPRAYPEPASVRLLHVGPEPFTVGVGEARGIERGARLRASGRGVNHAVKNNKRLARLQSPSGA